MLVYKFDVIEALKEAGYNTYRIKQEKILPQSSMQHFRTGKVGSAKTIDVLCKLLDMQPGNIIKYVPDPEEES